MALGIVVRSKKTKVYWTNLRTRLADSILDDLWGCHPCILSTFVLVNWIKWGKPHQVLTFSVAAIKSYNWISWHGDWSDISLMYGMEV